MPKPPFLLTTAQMQRLSPHFPRARGIPRADDRRVLSGILDVLRHGRRWRDAPLADASSSLPNVRNSRSRRVDVNLDRFELLSHHELRRRSAKRDTAPAPRRRHWGNRAIWRIAPAPAWRPRRSTTVSSAGVFDCIFAVLATEAGPPSRLMLDATHLKAHRTAASLLKKGLFPVASAAPRAG